MSDAERGVSLTEVLVAIALVALCVGGIISLLVQNIGLGQSVDNAYVAINLAKSRIERMREIRKDSGYTALPDAAETDTLIDRNGISSPSGGFKRTTIVDSAYAPGLTKVTVKVRYKTGGVFISVPVELVTLLSSYNL